MKGPLTCRREGPLRGAFEVPGDKSVSHRAILFSALAEAPSYIEALATSMPVRRVIMLWNS